ncbi:hypothetical protein Moror_14171 [Moniliophthora roreri MCA 2997]|uniref:BHLH domain-containing protein n=1 Tax=Moniliophthora roreri (strain MCA 2997) TaxID=1381753 RepID=V2X6J7_MONRO|nr:hypothetical protein Moror_14171 [Moniliophthora roreri MCA 2997]
MSPPASFPNDLYTGSCNPSRKAKQSRASGNTVQTNLPIQPRRLCDTTDGTNLSSAPGSSVPVDNSPPKPAAIAQTPAPTPAKRGRKPGTMSRSARETQRKLNHSIIEKARRTKINEALATLKQLVPSDFGSKASSLKKKVDSEDEDDGDEDYQEKKANKKSGKKEEKEKEFKLEILVRTVSFMEHLIGKVKDLENQLADGGVGSRKQSCPNCTDVDKSPSSRAVPLPRQATIPKAVTTTSKRKRNIADIVDIVDDTEDVGRQRRKLDQAPSPESIEGTASGRPRLPSISTWLPDVDPRLQVPSPNIIASVTASPALTITRSPNITAVAGGSYLPSPPSSTHFTPTNPPNMIQMPPSLSLGPTAEPRQKGMRSRSSTLTTPEEESAASVLLHFRSKGVSSPQTMSTLGSSSAFGTSPVFPGIGSSSAAEPLDLGPAMTQDFRNKQLSESLIAQTPSSILGLGLRPSSLSSFTT